MIWWWWVTDIILQRPRHWQVVVRWRVRLRASKWQGGEGEKEKASTECDGHTLTPWEWWLIGNWNCSSLNQPYIYTYSIYMCVCGHSLVKKKHMQNICKSKCVELWLWINWNCCWKCNKNPLTGWSKQNFFITFVCIFIASLYVFSMEATVR